MPCSRSRRSSVTRPCAVRSFHPDDGTARAQVSEPTFGLRPGELRRARGCRRSAPDERRRMRDRAVIDVGDLESGRARARALYGEYGPTPDPGSAGHLAVARSGCWVGIGRVPLCCQRVFEPLDPRRWDRPSTPGTRERRCGTSRSGRRRSHRSSPQTPRASISIWATVRPEYCCCPVISLPSRTANALNRPPLT
jgi:hypothetical protein